MLVTFLQSFTDEILMLRRYRLAGCFF